MGQPRILITWVGSFEKRVIKGIDKEQMDFVYFLLESRSNEWLNFQQECLKNIFRYYGNSLRDKKRSEVVPFPLGAGFQVPVGIKEAEFCRIIFQKLFEIVSTVRKKYQNPEITLDVTAAPRMITIIISFLAMILSTKESRIKLQLIPKGFEAEPFYYVPAGSNYFRKHVENTKIGKMSLAEYRRIEKNDDGGPDLTIELPITEVPLLYSRSNYSYDRINALAVLFQKIPSRRKEMISSKRMLDQMTPKEKELVLKSLKSQTITESQKPENDVELVQQVDVIGEKTVLSEQLLKGKKKVDTHEIERVESIWVSKNLAEFENQGLVEIDKGRGKLFYAKKTWAGDLVSGVVEERYDSFMHQKT